MVYRSKKDDCTVVRFGLNKVLCKDYLLKTRLGGQLELTTGGVHHDRKDKVVLDFPTIQSLQDTIDVLERLKAKMIDTPTRVEESRL